MLLPKPTVRNSSRATAHDAPKSAENLRPSPSSSLSASPSPPSEPRPARSAAAVAVRVTALAAQRLVVFHRGESFLPTSLSPSRRSSNPWSAIVSPTQPSQRHHGTLRARQLALRPGSQPQPTAPSPLRSSPSHGTARVAAPSPCQPAAVARPRPPCHCSSEPAQTSETTFPIRAAPALSWSSRPCRVSDPPPAVSCTSNRARAAPRHAIAAASCN
eukprot:XP_020406395.1 formin-like protein 6 [Zea mays]